MLDAGEHTLTPGFIDCHVHLTVERAGALAAFAEPFSLQFYRSVDNLRKTLHAGVTTVRDAGGADAGLASAVRTGLVAGPRVKLAVSIMSQTGGHGDPRMPSGAHSPMLGEHPGRPSGVADAVNETVVLAFIVVFVVNTVLSQLYSVIVPAPGTYA